MICLATDPDSPVDRIAAPADSNQLATEADESLADPLPLWSRLPIDGIDWPESTDPETTPTLSRLFWRGIVSQWSLKSRQEWGDRANALQDSGLDWKTAERLAFEQVMRNRASRSG